MPTPSSGSLSFATLRDAFGTGNPVSFQQLYRGGAFVPNISTNGEVPLNGAISLHELYSKWSNKTLSFTINVGQSTGGQKGKKGILYGFGSGFGSIVGGAPSFLTPVGTLTIRGLYYSTNSNHWHLQLGGTATVPNNNLPFKQVNVTGYNFNGLISTASSTLAVGATARRWNWTNSGNSHPVSGTISCSINYYG
jgi:hypothetical protein